MPDNIALATGLRACSYTQLLAQPVNCNAPLVMELNGIHAVNKVLRQFPTQSADLASAKAFRKIHVHMIQNDELMQPLGFASKANASAAFLDFLFEGGRATAERWLDNNYHRLGQSSSCNWKDDFDLEHDFIDPTLKGGKTQPQASKQGAYYGMQ